MARFDEARFALEAASGGRNTILLDDAGMPSVMVRIPSFRWSEVIENGEDETCSAFIVGGEVKDCIYISKYLNIIDNGRAYSLPNRDPSHNIKIDEARAACAEKGRGWHLMSNAEWAAIAHWCRRNGHFPRGNNNFGRDIFAVHEHGAAASRSEDGDRHVERTLTGGADAWSHDGSPFGIFDLNGNVWDYVSGLRAVDGEIQIIEDNNSALNVDEGPNSPLWRAIDMNGRLVAPGGANTYKFDGVNPGREDDDDVTIPGGAALSFEVRNPHYTGGGDDAHCAFTFMPFKAMAAVGGAAPHIVLKQLGLYPVAQDIGDAMFFIRNYGERMACRGGSWFDGAAGGLWDLYMRETREFLYPDIGFRSAYVI